MWSVLLLLWFEVWNGSKFCGLPCWESESNSFISVTSRSTQFATTSWLMPFRTMCSTPTRIHMRAMRGQIQFNKMWRATLRCNCRRKENICFKGIVGFSHRYTRRAIRVKTHVIVCHQLISLAGGNDTPAPDECTAIAFAVSPLFTLRYFRQKLNTM